MRELSSKRKERVERTRQRELEERVQEESKKNPPAVTPKKRAREDDNARPMAVGAHGVAKQDGTDNHNGMSLSCHLGWCHNVSLLCDRC
jgi:hypothetical protein